MSPTARFVEMLGIQAPTASPDSPLSTLMDFMQGVPLTNTTASKAELKKLDQATEYFTQLYGGVLPISDTENRMSNS